MKIHKNAHKHPHVDAQMCIVTRLLTQTKLWTAGTRGFCLLQAEDGGYNPGFHTDTQQSSADFSGSCRAQHFPLSTLSSLKSPWQRTCWYSLLCQNWHYKKSCLHFQAVNNFWQLTAPQTEERVILLNVLWPPLQSPLMLTSETSFISL